MDQWSHGVLPTSTATAVWCRISCEYCSGPKLPVVHLLPSYGPVFCASLSSSALPCISLAGMSQLRCFWSSCSAGVLERCNLTFRAQAPIVSWPVWALRLSRSFLAVCRAQPQFYRAFLLPGISRRVIAVCRAQALSVYCDGISLAGFLLHIGLRYSVNKGYKGLDADFSGGSNAADSVARCTADPSFL